MGATMSDAATELDPSLPLVALTAISRAKDARRLGKLIAVVKVNPQDRATED